MSSIPQTAMPGSAMASLGAVHENPQWYVLHTLSRHERRVAQQMQEHHIEHFLPLYRSMRRWSDRSKELELPLFAGYVFVHTDLRKRVLILQARGVVQFVSFQGKPAAVPGQQIEFLRGSLRGNLCVEPFPYLNLGRRVRVHRGPLAGMEGFLASRKGRVRVVLSVDLICRSVAVEVGADEIEPAAFGWRSREGGWRSTAVETQQKSAS
ncbi:MAG TPA: UpxY family transcription antiterminator [Terriglobales bacterium]|nr:UpxY family transcription antiterminator [Terriglobales bacterium]